MWTLNQRKTKHGFETGAWKFYKGNTFTGNCEYTNGLFPKYEMTNSAAPISSTHHSIGTTLWDHKLLPRPEFNLRWKFWEKVTSWMIVVAEKTFFLAMWVFNFLPVMFSLWFSNEMVSVMLAENISWKGFILSLKVPDVTILERVTWLDPEVVEQGSVKSLAYTHSRILV